MKKWLALPHTHPVPPVLALADDAGEIVIGIYELASAPTAGGKQETLASTTPTT